MGIIRHCLIWDRRTNRVYVGKEQKMTREEALQILDTIPTISEQVDALEMAIQALSQEPCDDAISRQAVIELCKNVIDKSDLVDVAYEVRRLPSVTQKSGKWKYVPDADGFYICSECGCGNGYADNFCPQCGAKMVELQESEDKE